MMIKQLSLQFLAIQCCDVTVMIQVSMIAFSVVFRDFYSNISQYILMKKNTENNR